MHRIFLGFRCNNRCVFCAQGELSSASGEIGGIDQDLETIAPGTVVAFLGGEPTLVHELPEWVRRVKDRGALEVIVQTNGRRLSDAAYTRALVEAGVSRFEVALQGATGAMHDFHTSVPGSFAQTGAGVRRARGEGASVTTTTVVTRSNYRHLPEIVDLVRTLGAIGSLLRVARPLGRAAQGNPPLVPPHALARPFLARALTRARQTGFPCHVLAQGADDAQNTPAWVGLGPF